MLYLTSHATPKEDTVLPLEDDLEDMHVPERRTLAIHYVELQEDRHAYLIKEVGPYLWAKPKNPVQRILGGRTTSIINFVEHPHCDIASYKCIPCHPSLCAINPHSVWWTGSSIDLEHNAELELPHSPPVLKVDGTNSSRLPHSEFWESPTYTT